MQYIDFKTLLYSDTLVPDIFINEYLPALNSDYVKIYLYCLFLVGKNLNPTVADLARILDIPLDIVKKGLHFMDNLKIISWTEDGIVIKDLKEMEINKFYRPKSTSTPEEAAESSRINVKRRQVIDAINTTFFSGAMSVSWYGDIDMWFGLYGFEEDVMMLLFRHCSDKGVLKKNYIAKVAENMHHKGVKNSYDFDRYIQQYEYMKTIYRQVQKYLKIDRQLTESEEEIVSKWIDRYGFSFDIIKCALYRSTARINFGLSYFDSILTDWHKRGIDTVVKAQAEVKRHKAEWAAQAAGAKGGSAGRAPNRGGFKQRSYDAGTLEKFVSNEFGAGGGAASGDVAGAAAAGGAAGDGGAASGAAAGRPGYAATDGAAGGDVAGDGGRAASGAAAGRPDDATADGAPTGNEAADDSTGKGEPV